MVDRLEKDFPESVEPLIIRGMMFRERGDHAQAVTCWQEAIVKDPERADVLNHLGMAALELEAYDEATAYWRRAVVVNPRLPGLRQHMGFALLELGRPFEAIMMLQQEVALSPQSGMAWTLLGQCCLQAGESQRAKSAFARAVAIDPRDGQAYYGLMTAAQRLGASEEAQVYGERFQALSRGSDRRIRGGDRADHDLLRTQRDAVPVILEASALYRHHGHLDKAQSLLAWATQIDREKTIEYLKQQVLYEQTEQRPARALALMVQVTALEPNEADNYLGLGKISEQAGDFEGAERAFERLISLAPRQADGYRELARLHLTDAEKPAVALALAERAVRLEERADHYYLLGAAHLNNRQLPEARAAMQRALQLDPENPGYRQALDAIGRQMAR